MLKKIQKILEKYNFWPIRSLKLKCIKLKYFICQFIIKYKFYIKKHKYDKCKFLNEYNMSITYSKNWKWDVYALWEKHCHYIIKKYYINCIRKKGKYIDYKNLLSKCMGDNNYFYFINKYFSNLLF